MATLATSLTRHSLIIGVACKFAIRRLLVCLSTLKPLRTPCACRTAPAPFFPQHAVQAQFGRYAIRGCAYHLTDVALIDHRCGLQVGFTTLTDIFVYFQNFKHSVHAPHRIQNAFPLLVCLNRSSANNAEGQRVLRGGCGKQRQGWRSAGVEPWMGSSTDEHRPRSTMRTTLDYSTFNIQHQQMRPSLLRAGRPRSQIEHSTYLQYSTSADVPKSFAGGPPALPDNALPAETLIIKRHILARWF